VLGGQRFRLARVSGRALVRGRGALGPALSEGALVEAERGRPLGGHEHELVHGPRLLLVPAAG